MLIERVIDVAGSLPKIHASQAGDFGARVRRPRAGEYRQDLESLLELSGENVCVSSILKPPESFSRLTCSCSVLVNRTRRGVNAT